MADVVVECNTIESPAGTGPATAHPDGNGK